MSRGEANAAGTSLMGSLRQPNTLVAGPDPSASLLPLVTLILPAARFVARSLFFRLNSLFFEMLSLLP
jgi:hypothetical protein